MITGVFLVGHSWKIFLGFPGPSWPLQEATFSCGMERNGATVVHTCLFWPVAFGSTFVGTGMSWFYFVSVDDEVFLCFILGLI